MTHQTILPGPPKETKDPSPLHSTLQAFKTETYHVFLNSKVVIEPNSSCSWAKTSLREVELRAEQEEEGGPNYILCLFLFGSQRFENSPNPHQASAGVICLSGTFCSW